MKRVSFAPRLAALLHLVLLELLFTERDVPIACNLVKLASAPLTLDSIVHRFAGRIRRVKIRRSTP